MKKKLTEKEEMFARAFIELGSQSGAYRKAYTAGKMSDRVITSKAYEVAVKPHVSARIEELREAAKERNKITVDSLIAELEENRQAALCAETPQAAAATAATMGKAKLLGLDKQIIEHTGPGGSALTPTVIQLVGPADDDSQA
ncbi:terminase small subunit [Pseudomonas sp.]|uniref:terminase small subunit n=1 Tax=Pseudomonas sp. TaxID=306 RepID=UPI002FCB3C00